MTEPFLRVEVRIPCLVQVPIATSQVSEIRKALKTPAILF